MSANLELAAAENYIEELKLNIAELKEDNAHKDNEIRDLRQQLDSQTKEILRLKDAIVEQALQQNNFAPQQRPIERMTPKSAASMIAQMLGNDL